MVKKFNCLLVITIVVILFSCSSSNKKNELKQKNEKAAKYLALKYKAITNWDSIPKFSFIYQKMFIEDGNLMFFKGRIYDIIKIDSNYIIKVLDEREDEKKYFLAFITFNSTNTALLFEKNKSTSGVFIINILKVSSTIPRIRQDDYSDGDDNTISYTHLSDDADIVIPIFKGELVDFYLNEIPESK